MRIEKVVINASPFILLAKSGLTELLPQLFAEIRMPEAVMEEIAAGGDIAADKFYENKETWINIYPLQKVAEEVLVWNLGDGETEVLSFAFSNKTTHTALIDDRAARKCAETLQIKTLGTGGILILAKKRGLIESVAAELKKLQNAGLWISDEIAQVILRRAGELE
ncbi:MAG: DUF3368 domain-containing protein [Pyrinomonadaceae bacterium]